VENTNPAIRNPKLSIIPIPSVTDAFTKIIENPTMQIIDNEEVNFSSFLVHLVLGLKRIPPMMQRIPIMTAVRHINPNLAKSKSITDVGLILVDVNIIYCTKSPIELENTKIPPSAIKIVFIDLISLSIIKVYFMFSILPNNPINTTSCAYFYFEHNLY
jgi:hypothetical protein